MACSISANMASYALRCAGGKHCIIFCCCLSNVCGSEAIVWATKAFISFNDKPPLINDMLLLDNEGADAGEGIEELLPDLDSIKMEIISR